MALPANTPVRKKAKAYIDRIKPYLPLKSTDKDPTRAQLYKEATRYTQTFLEEHWDVNHDNTTSCNAFAGEFVRTQLGGPFVGGFHPDDQLPKIGKANAWVWSDYDVWPQYGDVLLHAGRGHMSVIVDLDPWISIQGGFDGSGRGNRVDVIGMGKGRPWDPSAVIGWIDLDEMFPPKPAVPYWMLGWWKVTWDEDTYYYYFNVDWSVTWTYIRPRAAASIQIPKDGGRGSFSNPPGVLQINWRSGSMEQFWYGDSTWPMEFWGKHNGEGVLHVTRFE